MRELGCAEDRCCEGKQRRTGELRAPANRRLDIFFMDLTVFVQRLHNRSNGVPFIDLCLRLSLSFCLSCWIQSDTNSTVSNTTVSKILTSDCIQNFNIRLYPKFEHPTETKILFVNMLDTVELASDCIQQLKHKLKRKQRLKNHTQWHSFEVFTIQSSRLFND